LNPFKKLWNLFISLQLSMMWWFLTAILLFYFLGYLGILLAFFLMYYARYTKRKDLKKIQETARFISGFGDYPIGD
jgi:hypothetical protein